MSDLSTPRPWMHDGGDAVNPEYIFGPNGEMVAEMRGWGSNLPIYANAELIVRAVNSYDATLDAMETVYFNILYMTAARSMLQGELVTLRSAIASARGKSEQEIQDSFESAVSQAQYHCMTFNEGIALARGEKAVR